MERRIKIQSENSIVQTFDNQGGSVPTNRNLDFKIPEGMVIDMEKSSVNIEMKLNLPEGNKEIGGVAIKAAKLGVGMLTKTGGFDQSHIGNGALLIRNAQLYSQKRGMLESIRRLDTLSLMKYCLENDDIEIQRNLDSFGELQQHRGHGVFTTRFVDEVRVTDGDGITAAGEGDNHSRNRSSEVRIMLKDIFGLGSAPLYDTSKYGETKMNFELNLDKLFPAFLQGQEADAASGTGFRACDDNAGVANGTAVDTVTLTETYEDPDKDCPFMVGQAGTIAFTGSVQGAAQQTSIIRDISYTAATRKLVLSFTRAVYTSTGAPENFTGITYTPLRAGNPSITIENAELNLVEVMSGEPTPNEISYISYSTEEIDGSGLTTSNKRTHLEPNAQTLYVASCPTGDIAPDRALSKYRIAINNEDISGNRDIEFGKPLQRDRVVRAYRNKNVPLKNLIGRVYKLSVEQQLTRADQLAAIVEPLELSQEDKLLQLQLTSSAGGNQDIILYKELVMTK